MLVGNCRWWHIRILITILLFKYVLFCLVNAHLTLHSGAPVKNTQLIASVSHVRWTPNFSKVLRVIHKCPGTSSLSRLCELFVSRLCSSSLIWTLFIWETQGSIFDCIGKNNSVVLPVLTSNPVFYQACWWRERQVTLRSILYWCFFFPFKHW